MEDCCELDDLLDEIESKLYNGSPPKSEETPSSSKSRKNANTSRRMDIPCSGGMKSRTVRNHAENEMSLDEMIADICLNESSRSIASPSTRNSITTHQTPQGHLNQEPPPKKACNNLRCTSCDFDVVFYQDVSWHPKSDYLFFRNNVPNYSRLKTNLVKNKGFRAYACQCQWVSVSTLGELSSWPELKWVCCKHS